MTHLGAATLVLVLAPVALYLVWLWGSLVGAERGWRLRGAFNAATTQPIPRIPTQRTHTSEVSS